MSEKRFLSVQEVADRWGLSYPAVRSVISEGRLPASRLGGRRMKIDIDDLVAYEAAAKGFGAVQGAAR